MKPNQSDIDVRGSMKVLPKPIQPFLTWLTAKPLDYLLEEKRSAIYHLLTALLATMVGVFSSIIFIRIGSICYFFILLSLILTTSGLRKLQVVIYHHCSHHNVFYMKWVNYFVGEIISIVLLIKDFLTYRKDHMVHHSVRGLLTYRDETVQDLSVIGITPGLNKKILYRNLIISFISPFSQLRFLLARVGSSLLSPYWMHNLIAIIYWAALIAFVNHYHWWLEFCIAWVIPLTILYHISRTLRLVVEHTWPEERYLEKRNLDFVYASTIAVFLGEPCPVHSSHFFKNAILYVVWGMRMLTIHLFSRVFVLVGDTPCHDYHHRNPSSKEWTNYIYARQRDQHTSKMLAYQEIWGFFKALDVNLESMSRKGNIYV